MRGLRIALIGAVIGGTTLLGAAPASATCRPESKVPCEVEWPDDPIAYSCTIDVILPDGQSATVNWCELIPQ